MGLNVCARTHARQFEGCMNIDAIFKDHDHTMNICMSVKTSNPQRKFAHI